MPDPRGKSTRPIWDLFSDSDMFEPDGHPDLAISHWPQAIEVLEVAEFKNWGPLELGTHIHQLLLESPDCVGFSKPMITIDVGLTTGVVIYGGRTPGKSDLSAWLVELKTLGYSIGGEPEMCKPVTFFDEPDEPLIRALPDDPSRGHPAFDAPNRRRFKRSQRKRR